MENNETKDATSNDASKSTDKEYSKRAYADVADTAIIVALMLKQLILDRYGDHYEFCDEVVKHISRLIAEIKVGTDMHPKLAYYHPTIAVRDIVNYVYNYIKCNVDKTKCGEMDTQIFNDFTTLDSFIKDGITDGVCAIRRLSFSKYAYTGTHQKYVPYNVLADRVNAFNIVMPKLNPEYGGIMAALICASDNIDMSQFISYWQPYPQGPVPYGQFGRPPMQQDYKSPFQTFESFMQNKDSTKK